MNEQELLRIESGIAHVESASGFVPNEIISDLKKVVAEVRRLRNAHEPILAALEEAYGVITEPGMMDVDEWKAWQHRTGTAIALAKGEPDGD